MTAAHCPTTGYPACVATQGLEMHATSLHSSFPAQGRKSGRSRSISHAIQESRISGRQSPTSNRNIRVHAGKNEDDQPKVDWDAAWARMREQLNSQVDTKTGPRPPPFAGKNLTEQQRNIRKQENIWLDIWTSPYFSTIGILAAVVVLITFLFGVGPPPSDPRCTLPWC